MKNKYAIKTACVHSGTRIDKNYPGAITPIYPSTAYGYIDLEKRSYPRYFNTPNQEVVAQKLCALENGEDALVFSSGMAAISTTLLSVLGKSDHAVFQKGLYGGTTNFINTHFQNFDYQFSITEGLSRDDFAACIKPETKIIYIETPSNPLMAITDIKMVADLARAHGLISLIDNTFASPVNQNPLDMGIDIVLHSATKYLGGHSDICAGAVISSKALIEKVRANAKHFGGSLNGETCARLERSMKTLAIRVQQQNSNALEIAEFLAQQEKVSRVYYPGLPSHPGYDVAKRQMKGFGGMLAFDLKAGLDAVDFQKELKLIRPFMSLGGVETTICSPYLTSHAVLSKAQREAEEIKDEALRLSVGIEDADELIADMRQALHKI